MQSGHLLNYNGDRMTKTEKVYKAIARTKRGLTTATIRDRFGVPNVSAIMNDLRRNGFKVKSVRTNGDSRWVA